MIVSFPQLNTVVIWGCFSSAASGDFVKIDGIMRKNNSRQISEEIAVFAFAHDNAPKYTALICKECLTPQEETNVLQIKPWPP